MIIVQLRISARGTYQGILGHISGTSGFADFFCALQKLFLQIQRIPPLDVEKTFLKINFYQSHVMAFGLKIPKWYNTLVLKIFFQIFFQKIGKNNLKNIFDQIFTKNICNTQVLYHFGIVRTNATTWL